MVATHKGAAESATTRWRRRRYIGLAEGNTGAGAHGVPARVETTLEEIKAWYCIYVLYICLPNPRSCCIKCALVYCAIELPRLSKDLHENEREREREREGERALD
jgi:hypothetical protein